ncbi:MAG: PqqD family peptide modification chaperone [Candidatus Poseidoniia archaeon]|jgi:radical SAM protein with 4Fe4S-binding SPASM domain|nr:PqqD family peptide modification chaperone [Candidatus Poseidoniia archaeon]
MLVRLCHNSFVRFYRDLGYISNQLTRHDRVYDEHGAIFLSQIIRKPRSIDKIVDDIFAKYRDADRAVVTQDFANFIEDLEADLFVVSGQTVKDLDAKEPRFRYGKSSVDFKAITRSALIMDPDHDQGPDTNSFFYKHFSHTPLLFSLQMEVTSSCNERCRHCYLPPERDRNSIDTDLALNIVDQLEKMGTLGVTFSGGELFLHSNISDILLRARKRDLQITILSNLTLLSDDLLECLKDVNISHIQTSIYSTDPTIHDQITRVPGSHAKTVAAIERLISADIPVQISCPVMRSNLHTYKDVVTWASERSMKAQTDFIMMARTDFSTDNLSERLSDSEAESLIHDIIGHDPTFQDIVNRPIEETPERDDRGAPVCGVGVHMLCLSADGICYPCSGWQGYPVGDVSRQSLEEIWNSSPELNKLRGITNASFPNCLSCNDRKYCSMCMVRNFNESGGDPLKINTHFCRVARINHQIVDKHRAKWAGIPK